MKRPLTKRQQEVLDFITKFIAMNKIPPTAAEIAERFKFANPSGAQTHLAALIAKGAISIYERTARGIVVL